MLWKYEYETRPTNMAPPSAVFRDLTILERQRDDDGQNKLLQILNGGKDNSSYIINRMNF
jgi:hypothetical protein